MALVPNKAAKIGRPEANKKNKVPNTSIAAKMGFNVKPSFESFQNNKCIEIQLLCTCYWGESLSSVFKDLHGFDISEFATEKAKKVIPKASLKILALEDPLPYPENQFDCITAVDVLEHTKNFEISFKKLVRLLKKGGYLILSIPLNEWPRKYLGFMDKDKTHVSVLKEKELKTIIRKNKMKIIDERHYLPFPIIYRIPKIPFSIEILLRKQ